MTSTYYRAPLSCLQLITIRLKIFLNNLTPHLLICAAPQDNGGNDLLPNGQLTRLGNEAVLSD
jgi:hypothetical protein